jgi:arginase
MGAGPQALIDAGLVGTLERCGHVVDRRAIDPIGQWRAEIRTAFDLAAELSIAVRTAKAAGRFPLVLAGNCGVSLGVCAALGANANVVWTDAHGDFNTPETTIGGFLDGMALAALTGRCWTSLAKLIPDFSAIQENHVWLLGARDLDPLEADALSRSAIHHLPARSVNASGAASIADAISQSAPLYLHIDVDVLDPSSGRANAFAAADGVTAADLADFVASLAVRIRPAAITLSAYDPQIDADGQACKSILFVLEKLFDSIS